LENRRVAHERKMAAASWHGRSELNANHTDWLGAMVAANSATEGKAAPSELLAKTVRLALQVLKSSSEICNAQPYAADV